MTKVGRMSHELRDDSLATPAWAFVADTGSWDTMLESPVAGVAVATEAPPANLDGQHSAETSTAPSPSPPKLDGTAQWAERESATDPQVEEVAAVPVLIRLPDLSKLPPEVPKSSIRQSVIREPRTSAEPATQPENSEPSHDLPRDGEQRRAMNGEPPRGRKAPESPPALPRATVRGDLPPLEALLRRRPPSRRRAAILAAMFALMIITGVVIVHYRASLGPAGGRASRRAEPTAAEPAANDPASRNGSDAIRPLPDPDQRPSTGIDTRWPPSVRTAEQSSDRGQGRFAALPRDDRTMSESSERRSDDYPHTDPATYRYGPDNVSGRSDGGRTGFAEGTRQPTERQPNTREPGVASLRGIIESVPFSVRR